MGLTRIEIRDTVKRCTYKPGYTLCVAEITEEYITVDLIIPSIADSWKKDATLALTYSWRIDRSPLTTERALLHAIRDVTLLQFETHEMDEWFMYNGRRVTPVHDEADAAPN